MPPSRGVSAAKGRTTGRVSAGAADSVGAEGAGGPSPVPETEMAVNAGEQNGISETETAVDTTAADGASESAGAVNARAADGASESAGAVNTTAADRASESAGAVNARAADGASESAGALSWAHPIVRDWFINKFGSPTEPQEEGWPHIVSHRSVLISAPTGSGKTLAAFLACIDSLVRKAIDGKLPDRTEVLYVSPLKALSNDVKKNLEVPLAEIAELAASRGITMAEIRTNVRTGDTLAPERRSMLKRPPHILVTTPESFYILLTAEKSRAILQSVSTVIVDEIHAIADDKRGSHLALSLERLEALVGAAPVRIGLSATQKPIDEIARFLVGNERPLPHIVQVGTKRNLDIAVEVPDSPLGAVASNEMWDEIYTRITKMVNEHRSTLVFVNTRRLAERVAHHLEERLGQSVVGTHHGSLSRRLRLKAEQQLKAGELKVLVATASLELGIDIGTVDLVCQIGSPRSIAVGLQRIGRAGHWRGAVPKGRIFATTRDELIECAALVKAVRDGELDRIIIPLCPKDVLAQQIVASCATNEWTEEALLEMIRRAYPYRNLTRNDYAEILNMLAEGVAGRKVRYGRYLHWDTVNGRLRGRRGARLVAITNGGAIPDNALYSVVAEPDQTTIGTVDEDFAVESNKGDIFLLGNTSWKIRRVEGASGRLLVEDAHGAPPSVPFWRGEAPARTPELSAFVSDLRKQIDEMLDASAPTVRHAQAAMHGEKSAAGNSQTSANANAQSPGDTAIQTAGEAANSKTPAARRESILAFLKEECGLDRSGGEQIIEYIVNGRSLLGAVPTQQQIIAERFFDESGGMQLVIHAPFGGRINKAWGLALRKKFCRNFNLELQAAATDDGINISLTEQHSFPLSDVFYFVHPNSLQNTLEQTALQSPLFTTRWRWDAGRALALLRFSSGRKVPPQILRMRAEDLLAAVFPDAAACQDNIVGEIEIPDHPLIEETMNDVLHEAMDMEGLAQILNRINAGEIKCLAVDTPQPSEFSHEILNANPYAYLDDAPLEERRARAVEMRRMLPDKVVAEYGQLDPAAIEQVRNECAPDIRDADELHDLLVSVVALPEDRLWPEGGTTRQKWGTFFEALVRSGRAITNGAGGRLYWLATQSISEFNNVFLRHETISQFNNVSLCDESTAESNTVLLSDESPEGQSSMRTTSSSSRSPEDLFEQIVSGWLMHSGPVTGTYLARVTGLPAKDIEAAFLRLEARGSILRGKFTGSSAETEWCERGLLARIHRLTIGFIRKQIEPVTAAQFMTWLFRWQHAAPETQLVLEHGLHEILRQLQGFEIAASSWESQILSRRVKGYKSVYLDNLCLTGVAGWARLSPHPALIKQTGDDESKNARRVIPTSASPITFYLREECNWMRLQSYEVDTDVLSSQARNVLQILTEHGASFFLDIVRMSNLLKSEVEVALWELVTAGLVTADGFDNLRALIDTKRRSGSGSAGRFSRPRHSQGRWSRLAHFNNGDLDEKIEAACWMLLKRYGVVFRELLARETNVPRWRDILIVLRRLEAQGKIRGGRFVTGFLGEQFALPHAVESLRASKNQTASGKALVSRGSESQVSRGGDSLAPAVENASAASSEKSLTAVKDSLAPDGDTVKVFASDPLNLAGILVPGPRVPSNANAFVVFRNGAFERVEEF